MSARISTFTLAHGRRSSFPLSLGRIGRTGRVHCRKKQGERVAHAEQV